ncbi:MAG: signal recognition particle receptor subunit alpha, partial [Defluviitaleaceae bacterium]|nr:signal recognition particle receptor subunit alpha [Defluviitaleaceae bacterium]
MFRRRKKEKDEKKEIEMNPKEQPEQSEAEEKKGFFRRKKEKDEKKEIEMNPKEQPEQLEEEVIEEQSETGEDEEIGEIEDVKEEKKGFFKRIASGLSKTRQNILNSVESVLKGRGKIDEELFEELEEALILADVGAEMSLFIVDDLRRRVKENRINNGDDVRGAIIEIISQILTENYVPLDLAPP